MQDIIRLDLGGVNAYLLKKEEKFVLVDTGGHMFLDKVLDKVLDNRRDRLKKGLAEHGVTRDNLALAKLMDRIYEKFESFEPDCFLKDGDSMEKFGMEGKILGLPGHTPGSIGIIWGDGQLIAGDILANLSKPSQAVNAQDFKHNVTMVYPGHGEPFRMELLGGKQRAI